MAFLDFSSYLMAHVVTNVCIQTLNSRPLKVLIVCSYALC